MQCVKWTICTCFWKRATGLIVKNGRVVWSAYRVLVAGGEARLGMIKLGFKGVSFDGF